MWPLDTSSSETSFSEVPYSPLMSESEMSNDFLSYVTTSEPASPTEDSSFSIFSETFSPELHSFSPLPHDSLSSSDETTTQHVYPALIFPERAMSPQILHLQVPSEDASVNENSSSEISLDHLQFNEIIPNPRISRNRMSRLRSQRIRLARRRLTRRRIIRETLSRRAEIIPQGPGYFTARDVERPRRQQEQQTQQAQQQRRRRQNQQQNGQQNQQQQQQQQQDEQEGEPQEPQEPLDPSHFTDSDNSERRRINRFHRGRRNRRRNILTLEDLSNLSPEILRYRLNYRINEMSFREFNNFFHTRYADQIRSVRTTSGRAWTPSEIMHIIRRMEMERFYQSRLNGDRSRVVYVINEIESRRLERELNHHYNNRSVLVIDALNMETSNYMRRTFIHITARNSEDSCSTRDTETSDIDYNED